MPEFLRVYEAHRGDADKAFALFSSWWTAGDKPVRVPGMDTVIRMAWRLAHSRTVEEAAAREYIYRWNLAVKAFDQCAHSAVAIFGAPHTLGM